jgi:hypothetical protein
MVEIVSGGYWEVDDMVCGVCEGEYSGRREDGMLLVLVVVQVKFNGWQSKRPKSM